MESRSTLRPVLLSFLLAASAWLASVRPAWAHVKWFSDFSYRDSPRSVAEAISPTFLALVLLSIVVIAAMVPLERWLERSSAYGRIDAWLADHSRDSRLVMRMGTGMVLLLAWQAEILLVPDLPVPAGWVAWLEFGLMGLLLFDATTALAGVGLLFLYFLGVSETGLYHMLDYLLFAGAGYYLVATGVRSRRIVGTALPALYASVGFSLCWVALEKIVWPDWGLYVLGQNPQLALGLDLNFFLLAAAFIEFSLGYLLIINLLQRPLALVITLVFFTTTLVFGKTEVIGHTLIHAALIVFILEGPGKVFPPPIALHRSLGLRTAFAAVNFAVLLAVLLPLYAMGAAAMHRRAMEASPAAESPSVGEHGRGVVAGEPVGAETSSARGGG